MRRGIIYLLVFILLLIAPSGVQYLRYYSLIGEQRTPATPYDPARVPPVPTPYAAAFTDAPETGQGIVLLDQAHNNQFTIEELSYLDSLLSQRGFGLLPYTGGDLVTALRFANAFVVITPLSTFTLSEVQAVSDFVQRGGRLLMIGDPTRFDVIVEEDFFTFSITLETDQIPLNSLANEFDIAFNGDYLYNTVENEGNFRNIIVRQETFSESALAADLEQLAFYGAHSLTVGPTGTAVLEGDDNTWSSATDRPGGLILAAASRNGHVLAIGDIHFLTPPYYTVYDNGRFISHIADFLTDASNRRFVLSDFPFFYNQNVRLVYTGAPDLGADAFGEIIALQNAFRRVNYSLALAAAPRADADTLYLGLYNQADDVVEILASAGITLTIDPPILTPAEEARTASEENGDEEAEPVEDKLRLIQSEVMGNVQMSGTALLLLDETDNQRNVVVLAASSQGLANVVDRLLRMIALDAEGTLSDCLLQEMLALCPTQISDEPVEAELVPSARAPAEAPAEEEPPDEQVGEEIDAVNQGVISLGETVEGTLAANENHAWTFNDGPAVIDVVVQGAEELDVVLELYDPNNNLMDSVDRTLAGEAEELSGVNIPDDGDYTIVVRDFFNRGGGYTLSVTESEEAPPESNGEGVFIFVDDDGTPLGAGFHSGEAFSTLLSPNYEVTLWISSEDGPLPADTLFQYRLVIWDSGDYRDETGLFGEDTAVLLDYIEEGGDIIITGSSPTILGGIEVAPLIDVEIVGDDPVLLRNLIAGDVIELDQIYETALSEFLIEDLQEESIAFFLRGPESQGSGTILGLAASENAISNQKTVILLMPFVVLPTDIQTILLDNLLNWLGMSDET